jgi:hypothetical protein
MRLTSYDLPSVVTALWKSYGCKRNFLYHICIIILYEFVKNCGRKDQNLLSINFDNLEVAKEKYSKDRLFG